MISIVIPTLNEASVITESLTDLTNRHGDFEVIVADGGSQDGTTDLVRPFSNVKIIESPKGRARQMNVAARCASGEILLFLHADTLLPPHAFRIIEKTLSGPVVVGGSFCLDFDNPSLILRMYALSTRINHLILTYGDQGLFLRRRTFETLGGFKDIPIMEDVEIQMRLRAKGRFVKLRLPVVTSARRYLRCGIIRQQALNTALVFLFHLGVSPSFLNRYYKYPKESCDL